jgi:acyl-CoA reductase-like NAD-dependent aldehyde dehydrogenase
MGAGSLYIGGEWLAPVAGQRWEEVRPGWYGQDVTLRREPVGVVAAIVPWNMPQFSIVVKLAPALLAGCAVVVKPAPETPLDALLLAEMLDQVGLPRTGTFSVNQPSSMDPAAPFGGVKASGFGRELGPEGLDEFLDVKAISVAPGEGTAR